MADHSGINAGPHRRRRYRPAREDGGPTDYTAPQTFDSAPDPTTTVPEDVHTVDGLLNWVDDSASEDIRKARAQAVLDAENEKPEDDRRSTLVGPLEDFLTAPSDPD